MIIFVAIGTTVVFEIFRISCFMTTCTSYRPVFPLQGIVGTRMIKIFHSLYLVKGNLRMALGAILPEFIVMNILVTACTFSKGKTFKLLHLFPILNGYFMAQLAINLQCLPRNGNGTLDDQILGRFKCFKIMTGGTIGRECSLVMIRMT